SIGKSGGDLHLIDPELSELHAIVTREREAFIIRDLGSASGTFVNDRQVVEAQLTNLDRIRLGSTVMTFHAAYLTPEAFARRHGRISAISPRLEEPSRLIAAPAPGRADGVAGPRNTLVPFSMFTHPLRFWPQALETGVFQLRRTWMSHFLLL